MLLHSLTHQELSAEEQNGWKSDLLKIEEYILQSFDRADKRSLVFFSAGPNLWEVLAWEFPLPSRLVVLNHPYLGPLKKALVLHGRYMVLVVDREKARMFTVCLGKTEEKREIMLDMVPQKVKAKKIDYGRDDKIPRHIEAHLHEHLKRVAKETHEFAKGKKISFLLLGGHKELLPKIRKRLLYPQNKMVLGEFVTELNVPLNEILKHSKQLAAKITSA